MAIGDFGKLQLYTGPIYKVFADDFVLDKHSRPSCKMKSGIAKNIANFYMEDSKSGEYKCLEYDCVLAERKEAIGCCEDAFKESKPAIMGAFKIEDPKERHMALDKIKADTECLFYNPHELRPSEKVTKKELAKRIRLRDEVNSKNKNKKK